VLAVLISGPVLYWVAFYFVWTTSGERALVANMLRAAAARVGRLPPRPV